MPELVSVLRKPVVLQLEASSRHAEALMPLFLGIEREWRVHAVGQVAAGMSLLMALLVQVARLSNVLEPARMSGNSRKAQQIEKFRAMVDTHFRERRPIEDYANEMGLTAGHLTRLCREVLNVSSQDVVNARILHEAQRELVYSTDGIKQIANLVGFGQDRNSVNQGVVCECAEFAFEAGFHQGLIDLDGQLVRQAFVGGSIRVVDDLPLTPAEGASDAWQPKNSDGRFDGPISVREAMVRSKMSGWPVGVAGPGGGTATKPVGLVWLAWAQRAGDGSITTRAEAQHFPGDRAAVRQATIACALQGLLHDLRAAA